MIWGINEVIFWYIYNELHCQKLFNLVSNAQPTTPPYEKIILFTAAGPLL